MAISVINLSLSVENSTSSAPDEKVIVNCSGSTSPLAGAILFTLCKGQLRRSFSFLVACNTIHTIVFVSPPRDFTSLSRFTFSSFNMYLVFAKYVRLSHKYDPVSLDANLTCWGTLGRLEFWCVAVV